MHAVFGDVASVAGWAAETRDEARRRNR